MKPQADKNPDKYHRILTAAVKVFAQRGFHQATIAQIARQAGVADGTIYLYFKNKDDILTHFYSYKARQVFARFRQAVDQADTALGKMQQLIRAHLDSFCNDPHMAVVYQIETRQQREASRPHIKEMSTLYRDMISEIVALGHTEGTIRTDLPLGLVKHMIIGAVDEVINAWLQKGDDMDPNKTADALSALFIHGIGTDR